MKKFLGVLKDILVGLLYLAFTAGLMLLVAGLISYFKPQDLALDNAALPKDKQLILWGAAGAAGSLLALWLERRAKAAQEAEAPKEAA